MGIIISSCLVQATLRGTCQIYVLRRVTTLGCISLHPAALPTAYCFDRIKLHQQRSVSYNIVVCRTSKQYYTSIISSTRYGTVNESQKPSCTIQ